MIKALYQLKDLKMVNGDKEILSISDLEINKGEIISILGSNGAGKSTLLRLLHMLILPTSGKLWFQGQQITSTPSINTIRNIGMVFQRPEFLSLTVKNNLFFPSQIRAKENSIFINDLIEKLNLNEFLELLPSKLSGGELQKIALVRILSYQPSVILLDEPTSDLDPSNIGLVEEIILSQKKEQNTIVWVTHNLQQALRVSDRLIFLEAGEIIYDIQKSDWDIKSIPHEIANFLNHA